MHAGLIGIANYNREADYIYTGTPSLVRVAFSKKTSNKNVGRDIGKRELLHDAGESVTSLAIISDFWCYNITPFFEFFRYRNFL